MSEAVVDTPIPQRLLDAALEAATIHGVSKLSMGEVARRADLSRQTLYRHYPSKDTLVAAVVTAETGKLIEQVVAAALAETEPQASLEAGLLTALTVLRDHPLLDRLVRTEPEALLPLLTTDSSPVMVQVRGVVEAILTEGNPDLTQEPVAMRRFADVVTRLLISYAVSAPDDPPEVVAHFLSTFLVHGAVASVTNLEATP
jgi:AcrR family transcriptional regulator